MTELIKYVSELGVGQEKLFDDNFSHKKWRKICKKAGLLSTEPCYEQIIDIFMAMYNQGQAWFVTWH